MNEGVMMPTAEMTSLSRLAFRQPVVVEAVGPQSFRHNELASILRRFNSKLVTRGDEMRTVTKEHLGV